MSDFLLQVDESPALSELEVELLELISMAGEPTTVLDEEMLASLLLGAPLRSLGELHQTHVC